MMAGNESWTVWAVIYWKYEYSTIIHVFTSKLRAEDFARQKNAEEKNMFAGYCVERTSLIVHDGANALKESLHRSKK